MIDLVDKIYSANASGHVEVHTVVSAPAKRYAVALRRLGKTIYNSGEEDLWAKLMRSFKAYRFRSSCAPLPFNHPAVITPQARVAVADAYAVASAGSGNESRSAAAAALDAFTELSSSSENPLGNALYGLAAGGLGTTAAALLLSDLIPHSQRFFGRALAGMRFLSPFDLRREVFFDRLYLIGSPGWYDYRDLGFVFHATRSPSTHVIAFKWINNRFSAAPSFPGDQPPLCRPDRSTGVRLHEATPDTEQDLEDAAEVMPRINLESVRQVLRQGPGGGTGDDDEAVEARLYILSGDTGVFMETEETASSYVIDLSASVADQSEGGEAFFGRKPNANLEAGMFLLVRTAGGGDMVQLYADAILARMPDFKPELQTQWKRLLRDLLRAHGAGAVLRELLKHGGRSVTHQTIHNWKWDRTIRPDSPNFEALMQVLGISSRTHEIEVNSGYIRRARMSAGMHIRRQLLGQIRKADLSALASKGRMEFHLKDDGGGGSMTAYRIEKILPDTHTLSYRELGHPIQLKEDLWH
ncbi:MAG TPA: hypothetical protein VN673_06250 [Clostridia bacterium]|nr:hypothetical protein [Clostridia bacterium]